MHLSFASIVAFAASTMALTVTSPSQGDQVDFSNPVDIKWKSVESDPKSIIIELVNMNGHPNVNKQIAENVKTSEGHYRVDKVWGIPVAEGYQINIVSKEKLNNGILGQSQQFNVTEVADPPKPGKRDSIPTTTKKTACTSASTITTTTSSPSPSCTRSTRLIKPSSRPCTKHRSSTPPTSSTTAPSDSAIPATTSKASATENAPAATSSTAGSASLAIPAAGSMMMDRPQL
ncbi:Ser-Thr-rich glycosyl-phosphatidyl-inositol-anchored membrane family-domain-containing protein [Aspergillus ambiguus]|uniref:GPI anchored serine-threonine rich family protein n=1 Tax=Aspergillus ambiguus TaxID=176160 RepID=UPI003CCDFFE8